MDVKYLTKMLEGLTLLETEAHDTSKRFGYWDKERNMGEVLALVHRNLSEALDAYYKNPGGMSDKITEFTNLEEALADAVIRICDLAGGLQLEVAAACVKKLQYNHQLSLKAQSPL